MNGYLVRALVALLLAVFLYIQARSLRDRPHRRRAFQLAAAALLFLVGFNAALAVGAEIGALQFAVAAIGVALFIGAATSLLLSFSAGEMRQQRERVAAATREYRKQRNDHREAKRKSSD